MNSCHILQKNSGNSYLQLLDLKFDCICLTEVWKTNLNSYQDYIPFFAAPRDTNVGGVAMFIKMITKYAKEKNSKFRILQKVKWKQDLWIEITNNFGDRYVASVNTVTLEETSNYLQNS